jgi:hypothetical protein
MRLAGDVRNGEQGREGRLTHLGELLSFQPEVDAPSSPQGTEPVVTPPEADVAGALTSSGAEALADPAEPPVQPPVRQEAEVPGFQDAARDIANTLVSTIAVSLGEVNRRAESERVRLDAATEGLGRAMDTVRQVGESLETIQRAQLASATEVQSVLARLSAVESQIAEAGKRLDSLAEKAQQQLDSLASLGAASAGLTHAQQSLNARLLLTERALRAADMERRKRDVTWERFVASLGNLEMRGDKRVPACENVRALVLGEQEVSVNAHIVDVSDRGLGLSMETEVAVGSRIKIDIEDASLCGTVRYCRPQDGAYSVGLLLEQPIRDPGAAAN